MNDDKFFPVFLKHKTQFFVYFSGKKLKLKNKQKKG